MGSPCRLVRWVPNRPSRVLGGSQAPSERVRGRLDPERCERREEPVAKVIPRVVRPDLPIRREQRAEVVPELDVLGRRVVDRADRHREHDLGDRRALLGDAFAADVARLRAQAGHDPVDPGVQERVEDGRHQDLAAAVRLLELELVEQVLRRLDQDRAAQGVDPRLRGVAAQLVGQAEQDRLRQTVAIDGVPFQHAGRWPVPAAPRRTTRDLVDERDEDLRQREDRQQRDDVGETLVERRLVRGRGMREPVAEAVEEGVGGLVDDDVVGEAEEGRRVRRPDIAEHERLGFLRVVRVGLLEGVRDHLELMAARAPRHAPAEGELEAVERAHDQRVRVAGMERRVAEDAIGRRRGDFLGRAHLRGVVHRLARGVVVDDMDGVAHGSRLDHLIRDRDPRRDDLAVPSDARILRDDLDPSHRRRAHSTSAPHESRRHREGRLPPSRAYR